MKRLLTALLIAPIRLYQRFISPAFAPRCRYYPTCSAYAVQAIRELGPIRGLDPRRLARCCAATRSATAALTSSPTAGSFAHAPTRSERADRQRPRARRAGLIPPAGGSSGADLT